MTTRPGQPANSQQPSSGGGPGPGDTVPCSTRELLLYFLRLGTFGFGGSRSRDTCTTIPEPLIIIAAGVAGFVFQHLLRLHGAAQ